MEILKMSNAAAGPSLAPFTAAAKTSPRTSPHRKRAATFLLASHKRSSQQQEEAKDFILVFVERFTEALVRQNKCQLIFPARPTLSHSKPAIVWLIGGSVSPLPGLALNYDDVVQSVKPSDVNLDLNFDFSGTFESILNFVSENPLAVFTGALAIALPLVLGSVLGKPQAWGTSTARDAYTKLGEEELQAQLLDIRDPNYIKVEGTPDLRSFKKRAIRVFFSEDESDLIEKVSKKFKNPSATTLYILDRFDGNAFAVAKLLATNGFKAAYAINGGAEGPKGWKKYGLPWLLPRKGFTFNFEAIKDVFESENSTVVPATIGVAAAAGVGLVVFSEAETALQLLGTAALVQVFLRKLLFAEDRKKTLKELQVFLDTRVAPKELVEELKGVGNALLPKLKALSDDVVGNGAAISETIEAETPRFQTSDATAPTSLEIATPSASEAAKVTEEREVSYASSAVVILSDLPRSSTPLSPYPKYADLKPPSSPTPSRP